MVLDHAYVEGTSTPRPDYWCREQTGAASTGWPAAVIRDEQPLVRTRLPKGVWARHMDVLTLDDGSRVYAKAVDETDERVRTGHLLADALLGQLAVTAPETVYDVARDEVWVEEVPDARLPTDYPRFRAAPAIDADSFYDAVATKLLLGDIDIGRGGSVENVLVAEDAYCVPIDYDLAGQSIERAYRKLGGAKELARHIDVPFSYERVEQRAAELAGQVDVPAFLHTIDDTPYLSLDDDAARHVVDNLRTARDGLQDEPYSCSGGWWPR